MIRIPLDDTFVFCDFNAIILGNGPRLWYSRVRVGVDNIPPRDDLAHEYQAILAQVHVMSMDIVIGSSLHQC
jgi:hypothetical protein